MRHRDGFTLVEILIALGILSITIPVVLAFSLYTKNMNNEARLRTTGTLLAERVSEELVAQSESLREQLKTEDPIISAPHSDEYPFTWRSTVRSSADPEAAPDQVEIIVDVTWEYNGKDRSLQVATYARK